MKRIAPLVALLGILPFSLPATAQEAAPGKPFLWRIASAKPSYLFGTIHLSGPRETTLAPSVQNAVDQADAVICEIPLDTASQMKAAATMISAEKPLSEVLPKDLYALIEAQLKQINPALTLAPLEKMQVWALSVVLPLLEEQLKNPMGKPLDAQLYGGAEQAGKEVGGLETLEEQLQALNGFALSDQLALLRATLDDLENARKENRSTIGELREAYLSGNLETLEARLKESMKQLDPGLAKRFVEKLFTERNHRMAERISAKLKAASGKSIFFAVGAGHLHGEDGVVRLLEKSGLKLERVEK